MVERENQWDFTKSSWWVWKWGKSVRDSEACFRSRATGNISNWILSFRFDNFLRLWLCFFVEIQQPFEQNERNSWRGSEWYWWKDSGENFVILVTLNLIKMCFQTIGNRGNRKLFKITPAEWNSWGMARPLLSNNGWLGWIFGACFDCFLVFYNKPLNMLYLSH